MRQAELETRRPEEDPNGAKRGGAEALKGASGGGAEELTGLGRGGWRGRLGGTSGNEGDLELAWTGGNETWKETWSWAGQAAIKETPFHALTLQENAHWHGLCAGSRTCQTPH